MSPSYWIGSGAVEWRRSWPSCMRVVQQALVFSFSHHLLRTSFTKYCQSQNLQSATLYQVRHSGSSIGRPVLLAADGLELLGRTRDFVDTFAPIAEGAIFGTSRALLALTLNASVHFASRCAG